MRVVTKSGTNSSFRMTLLHTSATTSHGSKKPFLIYMGLVVAAKFESAVLMPVTGP